ncbi:hypothetical protein HDU77_008469 [Chytriomyces hyalinus]|nr:hypothetical protein HDU77_008469 [Chytriomyces hyalinus]
MSGVQQFSLFGIPAQILALAEASLSTTVESETPAAQPSQDGLDADVDEHKAKSNYACGTCGIGLFASVDAQRSHFRSDWHAANVKRRLSKQSTLSLPDFEAGNSTESDSDSDTNDFDADTLSNTAANALSLIDLDDEAVDDVAAGSPFVGLQLASSQDSDQPMALFIYKQILFRKRDSPPSVRLMLDAINGMQRPHTPLKAAQTPLPHTPKWTLIMIAAGHFAAAVFEAATPKPGSSATTFVPTVLEHKTFHRYTTRRKQGGAQSANDSGKGKANSAGANLRRHNEMMLQQDIQNLLTQWEPYLASSSHIFIRCPPRQMRKNIFFNDTLISSSDPRIRSFPFITHRPTLSELTRAFEELTTVTIRTIPAASLNKSSSGVVDSPTVSKKKLPNQEENTQAPATPQPPSLQDPFPKLIDLIKRSKIPLLRQELNLSISESPVNEPAPAAPSDDTIRLVNTRLDDAHGTSLLHIASHAGHADVVYLLLLHAGADPTLREASGKQRPAYSVAESKEVRDAFRRAYAFDEGGVFDWAGAGGVPSPLTNDLEARQKEKEREKRRKQKLKQKESLEQRNKEQAERAKEQEAEEARERAKQEEKAERAKKAGVIGKLGKSDKEAMGMTPERRAMLDREKRALAAEARFRAQQGKCSNCAKVLTPSSTFEKFQYKYCSTECVRNQIVLHN